MDCLSRDPLPRRRPMRVIRIVGGISSFHGVRQVRGKVQVADFRRDGSYGALETLGQISKDPVAALRFLWKLREFMECPELNRYEYEYETDPLGGTERFRLRYIGHRFIE